MPGDKSISHRAVLLGALCEGDTRITGFGRSEDTEATIDAVRALGATVVDVSIDELQVSGVGLRGLRAPERADRLSQRGHARAPARWHPGRAAGDGSSSSGGMPL